MSRKIPIPQGRWFLLPTLLLSLLAGICLGEDVEVIVLSEHGTTIPNPGRPLYVRRHDQPFNQRLDEHHGERPPSQPIVGWIPLPHGTPRTFVRVNSLDDRSLYRDKAVVAGERSVTFADLPPGRYLVTAATIVQMEETYAWDSGEFPPDPAGTTREVVFPPIPRTGWAENKGQWAAVSLEAVAPLSGKTGRSFHYVMGVRYTYASLNSTYTHVAAGESGDDRDTALVTLLTDDKQLGQLAWAVRSNERPPVKLGETRLPQDVVVSAAEEKISALLAEKFRRTLPKIGPQGASVAAGAVVQLVHMGLCPDNTLDADIQAGKFVAGLMISAAVPGGNVAILVVVGANLLLDHLAHKVQEDRLRKQVAQSLFDDAKARIIRDKKGILQKIELLFELPDVASPGIGVSITGGDKVTPVARLTGVCPLPGDWAPFIFPETSQPLEPSKEDITRLYDGGDLVRAVADRECFRGVMLEDLSWNLKDLVIEDVRPPVRLNVPYFSQEDTEWCTFCSVAMLLKYYDARLPGGDLDKRPWEIAADYGKKSDETYSFFPVVGDDNLASYLRKLSPKLNPSGGWEAAPFDLRPKVEKAIAAGNPVIIGKGSPFGHAVVAVGFSRGGLWINNPGHHPPQMPFDDGSGVHTFLTWEEFQKIFGGIDIPNRFLFYCDVPETDSASKTQAIGLGNFTVRFFSDDVRQTEPLSTLSWDGTTSSGFKWVTGGDSSTTIPQAARLQVHFSVGNGVFDQPATYQVALELQSGIKTSRIAVEQVGPLNPGQYVTGFVGGGDPLELPETSGGRESVCLVLRSRGGEELDRCEFPFTRAKSIQGGKLDVVFCIDTTGSMADDIEAVQDASKDIIEQLTKHCFDSDISLRVGLVTYQDHSDKKNFAGRPEEKWLRKWPLTTNSLAMRDNILEIEIHNMATGGDIPEDLYAAMMCAMDKRVDWEDKDVKMGWRSGAAKIMLVMTDAPPHDPDFEGRTLVPVAARAAELDPVHVYPMILPGSGPAFLDPTVSAMTRVAEATGGEITRVSTASELPAALVTTVKIAIQRHRDEVWRDENPPVGLFLVVIAIGGLAVLAVVGVIARQVWGQRPARPGHAPERRGKGQTDLTGQETTRKR